jgi:hypothetical protein
VLLDLGKYKWNMNSKKLGNMRWYIHWIMGLANFAVIVQFLVSFFRHKSGDYNDKTDH